ncbi:MAG: hypothetical protein H6734_13325 [Alphaproteobacteria bacterium]|nr:hypothetical protein [Alphaproteobacteria bacterium]
MVALIALLACKSPPTPAPAGEGLVGDHPLNPFPVGVLHMADGHLDLDAGAYDLPDGLTPLRTERLAWRDGFSPAQTSVVRLDRVEASALPGWRSPTPGESGVRLLDRTTGTWLPVMAELDAHEEAVPGTLLVRPLVALPYGHTVAVALTTELTDPVDHFGAMFTEGPPEDLAPHVEHFQALLDDLGAHGLPSDQVALAWDFPVGDGTTPLRSAWSQVAVPASVTLEAPRNLDDGDDVAPLTWRATRGTFRAQDFLVDDLGLNLGADGTVSPTGEVDVDVYVSIPTSVADAPAGSVPVMVFGHGIFATPERYLDTDDDASNVNALADELGAIVVALRWRGLTTPDLGVALAAGADFARIHEITDRLVQAQANMKALHRLLKEGDLLEDPVFTGLTGQSLPNRDRVVYYGISLGAIEGAVMLADGPPLEEAVLHVGGSQWSTMLERSSNWPTFATLLEPAIPDALTRQRLYATSQLWWDPVDPIGYTADLAGRSFVLQESLGDQQVPNLTTRVLARSVGLTLLTPDADPVWGLETAPGPLQGDVRALVQMDPEVGLPDDTNRPAANSGAHEAPRHFPGVLEQTRAWLAGDPLTSTCGPAACSASNPGE